MDRHLRSGLIVLALIALGATTHLLPHQMGVSTIGAVGMLAAAFLPHRLALIPVLATALIGDTVSGFYGAMAMSFVYLAHLAATVVAMPILRRRGIREIVLAVVANALVFYLISNLTPMVMGYYPPTPGGWTACYVNALPFLARGILANLVFGGFAFGVLAMIGYGYADRFAAPQRN